MTVARGCGHRRTIPVVYGMPGPDLMDRADRGEVVLGGCMVGPPVRSCIDCGAEVAEDEDDDA